MPNTLLINSSKYAMYVRVLAGQGDGPLVTVDSQGHIHITGPGDPAALQAKLQAAVRQIEAGVEAFSSTMAGVRSRGRLKPLSAGLLGGVKAGRRKSIGRGPLCRTAPP